VEKTRTPTTLSSAVNGLLIENDKEQSGAEPATIPDFPVLDHNSPHRAMALF
jgi:hypothetical protein